MDFARKQLEKYGWSEGQGLGKNQDGISKPLRPKLKFDNAGLGHNISDEFSNPWWQRVYDEAANNIVTREKNDSIVLETVENSDDISIRKRKKSCKYDKLANKKSGIYKDFIKTSELNGITERKLYEDHQTNDNSGMEYLNKPNSEVTCVINEELFKRCGGRTAHKGARHGLKMNAKLARIEEQEKYFMTNIGISDSEVNEYSEAGVNKKSNKKKKYKTTEHLD